MHALKVETSLVASGQYLFLAGIISLFGLFFSGEEVKQELLFQSYFFKSS